VSVATGGVEALGGNAGGGAISNGGRYVVFSSGATNLVPDDNNGAFDVFLRDRTTGETTRVSVGGPGNPTASGGGGGVISSTGRYVLFGSTAKLISPDESAGNKLYYYDSTSHTLTRVAYGGANGSSISGDGRYVAFTNLEYVGTNIVEQIWVWDRDTNAYSRVSVTPNGDPGNWDSFRPSISPDGRYIAYGSFANNLVAGDNPDVGDVFVYDRSSGSTELVTRSYTGGASDYSPPYIAQPVISADGRYVAFMSGSTNLVLGDTNGQTDVFLRDLTTDITTLVSVDSAGTQANYVSQGPVISPDGRYIAFASDAWNLVPGDTNGARDAFVRDTATGLTTRVSLTSSGSQATGGGSAPAGGWAFYDGETLALISSATNLVSGDTNGMTDIFVRGNPPLPTPPPVPMEQTFGSCTNFFDHAVNPTLCQSDPVNSATGSFTDSQVDLQLPGIGVPFTLQRFYNSADPSIGSLGQGWTHSYAISLSFDANGNATFRGEDGQQILYTKLPDDSFSPPPGGFSTLSPVGANYELKRKDGARYLFDAAGRVTEISDRNGNDLLFSYANGLPTSITDTAGRTIGLTHNAQGLLEELSVPDGRHVTYSYTAGMLTSVTDLRGGLTSYAYDAEGRLTDVIDPNGHTRIHNDYGPDGRVVSQTDALGKISTFAWNPATQTSTMTDARGKEWKDVYQDNVLLRRIDPLGNETRYVYDENLNLVSLTDANGKTTTMGYDSSGNLTQRTAPAPLNYEESFIYDAQDNLVSSTDGRGNTTTFDYDTAGNLIRTTAPGSVVTEFGRDPAGTGLLTSTTDPRGKTTQLEYDSAGNLVEVTTPLGNVITQGYDSSGRMTSRVEPRGNVTGGNPPDFTWAYTYDDGDNLRTQTDPLGNMTEWTYDPAGNLASEKDANNRTTSYGYNDADELASVTAPDSTVTGYDYDEGGNLISRTDAKNHVTSYDYDPAGRLSAVTSPLGQLWAYSYDPVGNVAAMVTARGNATPTPGDGTIVYSYDALNRLNSIDYSESTPDVTFGFDANGNRTQMTDGSGTETYTYDALNRLTGVTRGADSFGYAYDPAGNVTRRTYPDGTLVDYTYDNDGRPATVATGGATTSYGYDAAGNPVTTTLPSGNGYVETRIYDRAGRLTEVKNAKGAGVLSRFTYTLDPVGNPTRVVTPTATTTYAYDALDQLTEVCFQASCLGGSDPFIRWAYDSVGNRTSETRPTGVKAYTYNDADQLLSASGLGGMSYSYDADGNQTAAGSRTFTYDLANHMASTTSGSTTISYSYNGDGKRLLASSGSQSTKKTKYLWDPNHDLYQLALERDGSNALRRRYIHGRDLVSMNTGGANYYYHHDGLGSVANLTSATGAAQWTYTNEPFGNLRTETKNNTKAPANLMRFTGELFDADTGLYHLRARQYDPSNGRFLTLDPLGAQLANPCVSPYLYVSNQPTVAVDPTGLRQENGFDLIADENCHTAKLTGAGVAFLAGIIAFIAPPLAAFTYSAAIAFEAVILVDCALLE
jgi:RHS repeat-associated protein